MEKRRSVQSGDPLEEQKRIPFELDVEHCLRRKCRGEMPRLRGA
jgi:hypothetical protein